MRKLAKLLSTFAIGFSLAFSVGIIGDVPEAQGANCTAKDNLSEVARKYIGRCRKGSINREFPGELLDETLGQLRKGRDAKRNKAWKLLNDSRFKK